MNNLALLRFEIVVSAKYSYKLNEYVSFGMCILPIGSLHC